MTDETMRAVDPHRVKMLDGTEAEFLLSAGGLRRLKKRFNVKTVAELLALDVVDCGIPILFEAMQGKNGGMTEDQFADNIPAHLDVLGEAIGKMIMASFPDRPTKEASVKPPEPQPAE